MPNSKKSKIAIIDDHPLVRRGLKSLIEDDLDLEMCGEASTIGGALKVIEESQPDLAVIDISLEDGNGLELVKQVKALHGSLKILVSSMHDESLFAERSLRAGARGYVQKNEATDEVIHAIHRVLSGKVYLSADMADRMLESLTDVESDAEKTPVERLSDRELEVLELVGRGLTASQIGEQLNLSVKTIESYKEHIKHKLNLTNSAEVTRYAVQWFMEQS